MSRLNSEFNYRHLVVGETVWAKIETLKEFLLGRKRAAALEEVSKVKYKAKVAKLEWLKNNGGLEHEILELQAEIMENDTFKETEERNYRLNREEIRCLEDLLSELYEIAEPTRVPGFSDEQMHELNAVNEFTHVLLREMYAEILCHGRPSPAKLHNAMSNPVTFKALQNAGVIPKSAKMLTKVNDPMAIDSIEVPFIEHIKEEV